MKKNPKDTEKTPMPKDLSDNLNNYYLWDRSGTPDPEVQRLESLLAEFGHTRPPLALPAEVSAAPTKPSGLLVEMPWLPRFAAAAVIVLALGIGIFISVRPANQPLSGPSWEV